MLKGTGHEIANEELGCSCGGIFCWLLPVCSLAQTASGPPAAPPATQDDSGPAVDNGPIVIPKKKTPEEPTPPPAPEEPIVKNPPELGNFAIRVDTSLVNVDVSVLLDKTKMFVPDLTAKELCGVRRRRAADDPPMKVTHDADHPSCCCWSSPRTIGSSSTTCATRPTSSFSSCDRTITLPC